LSFLKEGRRKKEEGRRKKEEGRRSFDYAQEPGRRKKEKGKMPFDTLRLRPFFRTPTSLRSLSSGY
jgi:hypothetical protein